MKILNNCLLAFSVIVTNYGFVPKYNIAQLKIKNSRFNNIPLHLSRNSSLSTSKLDEDLDEPDIIEKYSNWFGWFPPEKKWKSVRFTFYSISAGFLLAEGAQNLIEYIQSPKLEL
tara:strand:+ start:423 stop:767 length:345 start_codon:yes stop_codon:yes gene_type:complete